MGRRGSRRLTVPTPGRDNRSMSSYWPTDDGWPYADTKGELADPDSEVDDDLLSFRVTGSHVLDDLDPLERRVISAHYGLSGPPRSMKELHSELGLPRDELRGVLGSGLAKLRAQFNG
jgi:DNA-directed RNA polymerase sigma subunit (sigma70/sigma32)